MRVGEIQVIDSPTSDESVRLTANIYYDDRPREAEVMWFEVPSDFRDTLSTSGDPWLAALLPLASKLIEPLEIDAEVDSVLYESPRELMEWWRFWFPSMKLVPVLVKSARPAPMQKKARTAQFFSGGVDSFFTLLRHASESDPIPVDDLLIGWGFDIPIADKESFERARRALEAPAKALNKRLVPFATNIRETRFKQLLWGPIGHGNAMAAISLVFQGAYDRVLIPSTDGYRETGPWGSHATTDHLYSSTAMRIVHEGAAYTRLEKVALCAKSQAALSALRVCWRSQSDENCGTCEKCLRTMIALELYDSLEKAEPFSHAKLDTTRLKKIYCPKTSTGTFHLYYMEMRDEAKSQGRDDIANAIDSALRRSTMKRPLLFITNKLRANRHLSIIGRPLDAAMRRTIIV